MDALDAVEVELNEATEWARRVIEKVDGHRFTVRPDPTRWSAAECLAHLSLTTQSFVPVFRKAIDDARSSGYTAGRVPKMDVIGRALRWFLEPPVRQRVKTSAPLVPKSTRAKAEALAEFRSQQGKLIDFLREVRDLDVGRIRVAWPLDSRVKYNLYSAFRILAAHQRRHLWQAEQAVAALAA